MKKQVIARALLLGFMLTTMITLTSCATREERVEAEDLMSKIEGNTVTTDMDISGNRAVLITDLAVRLFQQSVKDNENILISPLSLVSALAMTANGAENNTLSQMEAVLGLPILELNEYIYAYTNALPIGEKYRLNIANSIWFNSTDKNLIIEQDFLQFNGDWYGAEIYKVPFNDRAVRDINNWVSNKTDGMIKDMIDQIPDYAMMYLINALSFDAEWHNIYNEAQVREGIFTKEDKTKQNVEMMYSTEGLYIEDTDAVGFIKDYASGKYAFVALLPNEGINVKDYVDSLTGEKLASVLNNPVDVMVKAAIPKFKSEYSIEMNNILEAMGMTDAFDIDLADFSEIGSSTEGNIYISSVIHKTFIEVNEKGTRAGAASMVEMKDGSSMQEPEFKTVYLDRPFVYMIIDRQANQPIFIGATMDISN